MDRDSAKAHLIAGDILSGSVWVWRQTSRNCEYGCCGWEFESIDEVLDDIQSCVGFDSLFVRKEWLI